MNVAEPRLLARSIAAARSRKMSTLENVLIVERRDPRRYLNASASRDPSRHAHDDRRTPRRRTRPYELCRRCEHVLHRRRAAALGRLRAVPGDADRRAPFDFHRRLAALGALVFTEPGSVKRRCAG